MSVENIKKIGVIGAGQMGRGIAHVAALAGYDVHLMDANADAVAVALDTIKSYMDRQVEKGKATQADVTAALPRITVSSDMSGFSDADLVIEAATEDETVKKAILSELCPVLKPEAIIASNTSSISITRLAAKTDRPSQFVGMHFMNPVPAMELVEMIRGIATGEETFKTVSALALKMGKTPVPAEDFPAFIVNRMLIPMINEAVYTLYEGVGTVAAIDNAMRMGAHHPMGPLQLADFIGLDTCLAVMNVLHEGLADSKYRPCPLLVKYVEAGWLGKKTNKGFYDYSGAEPVPTR
ncbi:3-hydroxybutyryl-CoA dehydrogenase [Magnetovibrio blakemorei]|uniref:3-hydroxybutyryl-CoA dehydrogenase n=1 Tax=Magnetovibrio blakemorei TaxID=28181 RepID=A0A1E5QC47_9PROT|nr:3-hydroxybutyryl-CoA dehydrogenase [Magnetovibrio blakemorei]OEJ69650.1 3-hydroxybutyryl-CoA dehydrogenase [Magnetovibrio blakemorei]